MTIIKTIDMKKLLQGLSVFLCLLPAFAQAMKTPVHLHFNQPPEARATFDTMWIDYDQTVDGKRGMFIHAKFTIYEMKGKDCQMAVYFTDQNRNPLKDHNQQFYTTA